MQKNLRSYKVLELFKSIFERFYQKYCLYILKVEIINSFKKNQNSVVKKIVSLPFEMY